MLAGELLNSLIRKKSLYSQTKRRKRTKKRKKAHGEIGLSLGQTGRRHPPTSKHSPRHEFYALMPLLKVPHAEKYVYFAPAKVPNFLARVENELLFYALAVHQQWQPAATSGLMLPHSTWLGQRTAIGKSAIICSKLVWPMCTPLAGVRVSRGF
jgi:hypothetical protein